MHLFPPTHSDPLEELFEANLPHGEPWAWVLSQRILGDARLGRKLLTEDLSPGLAQWIGHELKRLKRELERLRQEFPYDSFGTRAPTAAEDGAFDVLGSGQPQALRQLYQQHGYGLFAQHTAFWYSHSLEAVPNPDPAQFEDLVGYTRQLNLLKTNIERFMQGQPSLPTLLYGARGSGKSTSVKALRTAYASQGLRLVEVLGRGLDQLPQLLELLRPLPQRFVLYLDDLAIAAEDPHFHALKALLEGAVYARPQNVLVVATSNRRNLVTQSFADRPEPDSTDPAAWDTLQDKLALADRFGLVLTFPPFDQQHYLRAVAHLAASDLDATAQAAALEFARDGRGFSGRSARHFVHHYWPSPATRTAVG